MKAPPTVAAALLKARDALSGVVDAHPAITAARATIDLGLHGLGREAASAAPVATADDLIKIADAAEIRRQSKEACRAWVRRAGVGVKIGGLVYVSAAHAAASMHTRPARRASAVSA